MPLRKIVRIDEAKCNGCGLCVPRCAEGAIQVAGGKARLVAEVYCDGLGACLGECPEGAITVVQREAEPFDEQAARRHVAQAAGAAPLSCPGSAARSLDLPIVSGPAGGSASTAEPVTAQTSGPPEEPSALSHWPVQLHLVPPHAQFLQGADLVLVADCVPFALADFHRRVLRGRPVVIGCPKLDDTQAYLAKLAAILSLARLKSLTVVHMEVPCCLGLVRVAQAAMRVAGVEVPLEEVTISIRGKVIKAGEGQTPLA
jgi:Pyruvate/2-oxoacid:ferredoxin oxidoreductase delta subunit